jgi:hypothetical protein
VKSHHRWIALTVALTGIFTCLLILSGFIMTIARNRLPWSADLGVRDHYLAVGEAYSKGFVVGFFLSFFLIILAVVISAWFDHRRKRIRAPVSAETGTLPAAPPLSR